MKTAKTLKWLLILACLPAALCAFALAAHAEIVDSGYCGAVDKANGLDGTQVTWTLDDAGTLTISGKGPMADYSNILYDYYNDCDRYYTVAPWGGSESNVDRIKSVVIENGVTNIGKNMLSGCKMLVSATIPNSVPSIGGYAFYGCENLTAVTIPDSVADIGDYAFTGSALASITLPDGMKSIGKQSFKCCHRLVNVTIPDSMARIGSMAFYDCRLKGVFYAGTQPQWDDIDNSSDIKPTHFQCKKTNGIVFDETKSTLLFVYDPSVTSVTIPDSVTGIGDYAFYNDSVIWILVPENVKKIGTGAFQRMEHIYITQFGGPRGASADEDTIPSEEVVLVPARTVYYTGTEAKWKLIDNPSGCKADYYDCYLENGFVFNNAKTVLQTAYDRAVTSLEVPTGVTTIARGAFYKCADLKTVVLGDGVTTVGDSAFSGCSGLSSVTFGNHVASIGNWAFRDCCALTSLMLPDSMTAIGNYAFSGCTGLMSATLPDSLTVIENSVFSTCPALAEITIPAGVAEIKNNAFYNDSNLSTVRFGGTEAQWKTIKMEDGNIALLRAEILFNNTQNAPGDADSNSKPTVGDVDGDGTITAADARLALRASVGLQEKDDVTEGSAGYLACDADGDGNVTSADARLILRASVGLEDASKFGKQV